MFPEDISFILYKGGIMILCKKCGNNFKFKWREHEIECPYCNAVIDFSKIERIKWARRLARIISGIIGGVFIFIGMSLRSWFPRSFLLIALLVMIVAWVLDMFVFRPMAQRVITKMYDKYDPNNSSFDTFC